MYKLWNKFADTKWNTKTSYFECFEAVKGKYGYGETFSLNRGIYWVPYNHGNEVIVGNIMDDYSQNNNNSAPLLPSIK